MSASNTEKAASEAAQELLDIRAIRVLLDRYAFAMDRRDPALMRTCFTADADLSYFGGLRRYDRDSFADSLLASLAPFKAVNHSVSSIQVVVDGDTARADMHIFATMMLAETPSVIVRGVRVEDEYARTPEGWQVSKRRHAPFLQYELPTTPIDFPGVGGINE